MTEFGSASAAEEYAQTLTSNLGEPDRVDWGGIQGNAWPRGSDAPADASGGELNWYIGTKGATMYAVSSAYGALGVPTEKVREAFSELASKLAQVDVSALQ